MAKVTVSVDGNSVSTTITVTSSGIKLTANGATAVASNLPAGTSSLEWAYASSATSQDAEYLTTPSTTLTSPTSPNSAKLWVDVQALDSTGNPIGTWASLAPGASRVQTTPATPPPPPPTTQRFGAENVAGWGSGEPARAKAALNATIDRHSSWSSTSLSSLSAANMQFIACQDDGTGLSVLSPSTYANALAAQVRAFPQITRWEILNEPFGWWYRGNDNDPASYGRIARAAVVAGKAANSAARFFVALRQVGPGMDVKLKNGTWITGAAWNAAVLSGASDLFTLADGFIFHGYDTPANIGTQLDATKAWAWAQTGGNNKPFLVTESNLTDQTAQTEAAEVAAMPQFVAMAKARPWIEAFLIYAWRDTSHPWLGFLDPTSGALRQSRCDAFKNAI